MFGAKDTHNSMIYDIDRFSAVNDFGYRGGVDLHMIYASLVESRITNNLMLIGNPELCSKLGLNVDFLYEEIEELVVIRQKISFGKAKEETKRRSI